MTMRRSSYSGFTLFEVALSLGLVAFGVVSVLILFPVGIKAQQLARFRLLAAAKAEEMIDTFNSVANTQTNMDTESYNPWDVPTGYRVMDHDLEVRISCPRNGIIPMPLQIAQRIDSDGDEIRDILGQGGALYFSQPMATTGVEDRTLNAVPDQEGQKLVFAITGFAQLNAMNIFPMKSWPYYQAYPSPPGYGWHRHDAFLPSDANAWTSAWHYQVQTWEGQGSGGPEGGTGSTDPDIKIVDLAFRRYNFGAGFPDASAAGPSLAGATALLQSALAYSSLKALPSAFYDPVGALWPKAALDAAVDTNITQFKAVPDDQKWKYVQAMRFLAYGSDCMTRWKTLTDLGGQPSSGGFAIPSATFNGTASPPITLTHDRIVFYHELCLRLAMLYAASLPYDWGAPRPIQRALMTDYPLMEWDVVNADTLRGSIFGESGVAAEQWRPIAAQPITNIGRSFEFPDRPVGFYPGGDSSVTTPQPLWGRHADFTLTKPFLAAERCRQIVFWAVDWQSYEDFETAPSAPLDASKISFPGPVRVMNGGDMTMLQRLDRDTMSWVDHHNYAFRNPEKNMSFVHAIDGLATGSDVTTYDLCTASDAAHSDVVGNVMNCVWDHGTAPDQLKTLTGYFGADRNFNKKLDRGPLPASVHIRATTVGRYQFYDPRVAAIIK